MTVQNTPNFVDYVGDDATLVFNFTFRVDDVSWLFVDFTDDFDQFNVNLDQENNPGGNATYLVAPPSPGMGGPDPSFRVERIVPANQNLDYTRYGPFDAEASEAALDKLTMILQDQVTIIAVGDAFLQSGLDQEIIDRTAADALIVSDQLAIDAAQDAIILSNTSLITSGNSPGHTHVLADIIDYVPPVGTVPAGSVTGELLRWDNGLVQWVVTPYLFPAADGGAGQVLTTDGLGNITFQAGGGGGSATPIDVIGDINLTSGAVGPVIAAYTSQLRFVDNDETDVAGFIGFEGAFPGDLIIENYFELGDIAFKVYDINGAGSPFEVLRLRKGNSASAGQEGYIMANRGIFNYPGTFTISNPDPPLMVTTGAGEDGQTSGFLGLWNNAIQRFTTAAAAGAALSINSLGGDVIVGGVGGGATNGQVILGYNQAWQARTQLGRFWVSNRSSTAPSGGTVGADAEIEITTSSQSPIARMGVRASTDVAYLGHDIHGQPWVIEAQNTGGSDRIMATFNPDTGVVLNIPDSSSIEAARTVVLASGGLEVNNTVTGAGFERVLTASDVFGGITITGTPLNNQIAVWTGASDLEGDINFTYDGTVLLLQTIGGTLIDLRDNNTTGGAASVKIDFTDQIGTLQASIGTFPVVDTFAIISAAGNVLISGVAVQIDGYFSRTLATDAELNAIANVINTSANKIQGVSFYNTDQDVPVYAVGNADGDVWVDGAGTTVNTPV